MRINAADLLEPFSSCNLAHRHKPLYTVNWACLKHTFKLPHLHVLWPGSLTRNKVQHTAVLQLYCVTSHMCQRVVTGDSYVLYFSIYLWCRCTDKYRKHSWWTLACFGLVSLLVSLLTNCVIFPGLTTVVLFFWSWRPGHPGFSMASTAVRLRSFSTQCWSGPLAAAVSSLSSMTSLANQLTGLFVQVLWGVTFVKFLFFLKPNLPGKTMLF